MIGWLWGERVKFRRAQVLSLRGGKSFYMILFSILAETLLYIVNPSLSLPIFFFFWRVLLSSKHEQNRNLFHGNVPKVE